MPFDAPLGRGDPDPDPDVRALRRAKSLINHPSRWLQQKFSIDQEMCSVFAVQFACMSNRKRQKRLLRVLANELPVHYRYLIFMTSRQKVISFNDRRTTKHAAVMALFDRAIRRLESSTLESVNV